MRKRDQFHLRSTLMQHQIRLVEAAKSQPDAYGYLAETGTGKTLMVLAEFQARVGNDDIMDLLIIAPKGCIRNWYENRGKDSPSELEKHLDPSFFKDIVIAKHGGKAVDMHARYKLMETKDKPRVLFVNVEALSTASHAVKLCEDFLCSGKCMMVVDESTTIKSHRAQRSKTVTRLGRMARSRRIMSGLVTPRSPMDLWSQFNFLNPQILGKSYFAFRARYAKMSFICKAPEPIIDVSLRRALQKNKIYGENIHKLTRAGKIARTYELGGFIPDTAPIIDGYLHLDELAAKIAPHCGKALKKDCLDLPEKIYEWRDVELTPEQRQVYKSILENATAQLQSKEFVTVKNVLEQTLRLHQICCGHVKNEAGEVEDLPSHRPGIVTDILEDCEDKAIIWVAYERELFNIARAIEMKFGNEALAKYWGGNSGSRAEDEKRFLTDPNCRFMLATPATGGFGNTWTVANLVIYATNDWNLEHRIQSEDRCHRIGQTQKVTFIDLAIRNTVEERIINALRNKLDLAAAITGAGLTKWLV